MTSLRLSPSIDRVLSRPAIAALSVKHGHENVARAARAAADALRDAMTRGDATPASESAAMTWLDDHIAAGLETATAPSMRRVINATGVILHTNLGRAPLAHAAAARAAAASAGYINLEYDVAAGERGHRGVHCDALLTRLTGAEASVVVNNNAAATLLALAAIATGRDVIVSRGELVEIGGGFRVPDVMAQSGALLREVGTTNRTRVADYAAAVTQRTAMVLRVHPSNFRVEGFTERPQLEELATLAHELGVPLFEDLGSGWLDDRGDVTVLKDEPTVAGSIRAGADLVAFSGDKLLGGPQAGVVVGRAALIERLRRHPLMRALRPDKLTLAALEETLTIWAQPPRWGEIPIYRMLTLPIDEIDRRARTLASSLADIAGTTAAVINSASTVGGGSAPGSEIPTRLVAIGVSGKSAAALEAALRDARPPIVGRIEQDRLLIDLRTVDEGDDRLIVEALTSAASA